MFKKLHKALRDSFISFDMKVKIDGYDVLAFIVLVAVLILAINIDINIVKV